MSITNFPGIDNFKLAKSYNISSIDETSVICLGEDHRSESCLRKNAALISHIAKQRPLAIFIEGATALKHIPYDTLLKMQSDWGTNPFSYIDPSIPQENMQFYGWDLTDEFTSSQLDLIARSTLDQKLEMAMEVSSWLIQETSLRQNALEVKIQLKAALSKTVPHFDPYQAIRQMSDRDRQVGFFTSKESGELMLAAAKLENEATDAKFSHRTKTMVHTCQKIEHWQQEKTIPSLAIIIAGSRHLVEDHENTDPRYSLSSFYEELSKNKSVILLNSDA